MDLCRTRCQVTNNRTPLLQRRLYCQPEDTKKYCEHFARLLLPGRCFSCALARTFASVKYIFTFCRSNVTVFLESLCREFSYREYSRIVFLNCKMRPLFGILLRTFVIYLFVKRTLHKYKDILRYCYLRLLKFSFGELSSLHCAETLLYRFTALSKSLSRASLIRRHNLRNGEIQIEYSEFIRTTL